MLPEEAQEPSWGTAKGATLNMLLGRPAAPARPVGAWIRTRVKVRVRVRVRIRVS